VLYRHGIPIALPNPRMKVKPEKVLGPKRLRLLRTYEHSLA
jgi:hypothetical protein